MISNYKELLKKEKPGLYIHIPFCQKRCHYCDFLTFDNSDHRQESYVEDLAKEIDLYKEENIKVDSIYFGGGTPSYIGETCIGRIFEHILSSFNVDKVSEITIEVNPSSVSKEKISLYKSLGFNRISMGIQSLDDGNLKLMGRTHTSEDVYRDYDLIRSCGFDNVSLDLIFGLPGQSVENFQKDLDDILSLDPSHMSLYSLTIEEGTAFWKMRNKGLIEEVTDDLDRQMYHLAVESLEVKDLKQYEVSNFAKAGKESKHNLKYWRLREYLGLGLGSSSFFNGYRFINEESFEKYSQAINKEFKPHMLVESMDQKSYKEDYILMNLRLVQGIDREEYKYLFGIDFYQDFKSLNDKYINLGLMTKTKERLSFTLKGFDLSNSYFVEIL